MDETANQYARELTEAIRAAVARDAGVRACQERARAEGIDLKVSLDVVTASVGRAEPPAGAGTKAAPQGTPAGPGEMTAADRRFLRSLRIAADQEERG